MKSSLIFLLIILCVVRLTWQQDAISNGNCQCGQKRVGRIVGGMSTSPNEFPWMAGVVHAESKYLYCGASLINQKYLLTAGHCVIPYCTEDLAVVVGDDDLSTDKETPYTRAYRVQQKILHPNFKYAKIGEILNDIAILKTTEEIQFNEGVSVVCLPFKYAEESKTFAGDKVTATGWGTGEFSGVLFDKLQKVDLNVISNDQCATRVTNVSKNDLCTFAYGKDTCQYDNGGPLTYEDANNMQNYLVGIISRGDGCGGISPGVNVRVTEYLGWITEATPDATYCKI